MAWRCVTALALVACGSDPMELPDGGPPDAAVPWQIASGLNIDSIAISPEGDTFYWTQPNPEACPIDALPECPDPAPVVFSMPVTGGTPVPLVTAVGASKIAVTSGFVYFNGTLDRQSGSALMRVPRAGGPVEIVLEPQQPYLLVEEDAIYWRAADGLRRAAPDGSDSMLLVPGERPYGMVADATHLYWAADDGSKRIPKNDPQPDVETISPVPFIYASPAGHFIYTLALFDGETSITATMVQRVSVVDGSAELLAEGEQFAWAFAASEHHVYWATDRHIRRSRLNDGPAGTFIDAGAWDLIAVPGMLYYTRGGSAMGAAEIHAVAIP